MQQPTTELLNILVVSEQYNPEYLRDNSEYSIKFSNLQQLNDSASTAEFNIVIVDGFKGNDLLQIVTASTVQKNASMFVCGEVENKQDYYAVDPHIFFWDDKLKFISLEKIIHLARLKANKNVHHEENLELKKKLEVQQIMMNELEQTNNNLISATWREREMKKKLKEAIEEIEMSKGIIELQNKRISESINYARKIQIAINPTDVDVRQHLPESFILYKPKDVISGDFPWFYHKQHCNYIAAVDCTGHGVPGAMMSMIGNLLLNDIINKSESPQPGYVLDHLHSSVVQTLRQRTSTSNSTDGMDIILLKIDQETRTLTYASAHRPLLFFRNQQLTEMPGDRFPIGGTQYDRKRVPFSNKVINYQPGDFILIYSDGLPDQLGGPERKKFTSKQISEIATNNIDLSMADLEALYNSTIINWIGDGKQIDDILLIGIKF
jgi:serine phosphatase RsbU (regulator of sigma subunit)